MPVTFDKLLGKPLLHKHKVADISDFSVQGVPTGGTAGQVLEKVDSTDYNTHWATPSSTTIDYKSIFMLMGA